MEALDEVGLPAGVFNMVIGDGPTVGAAISKHPDIDMVSFTGSGRAGAQVQKDAADTVKRVGLELGGKAANVVLDDADPTAVAMGAVFGAFINSGQTCSALTRVLIPASREQEYTDAIVAEALTWEQVREMVASGLCELASHSHIHGHMDRLTRERNREEAELSRSILEARTGVRPEVFVFPFGGNDAAVRKVVEDAGYRAAFALGILLPWRPRGPCFKTSFSTASNREMNTCAIIRLNAFLT